MSTPVDATPYLTELSVDALAVRLKSRTRAMAAARFLYGGGWRDELPATLKDVNAAEWKKLLSECALPKLLVRKQSTSSDGTVKFALELDGAAAVETVLIPAKGRSTVCVSSQSGCTRACAFCATATLGFGRHLRAGEIVAQYLLARGFAPDDKPARNVVFMGMGEPMDNLDEVLKAIELLTQKPAPQLSAHHITVSTSGVLPGMKRFLLESRASLALSVNASHNTQREALMPQTRTWPLEALMDELRVDAVRAPKRIHFLEYVMFDGLNDTDEDADRLLAQMRGVRARVNLIPHNAFEGNALRPSSDARLVAFQKRIIAGGFPCYIRWSKGRDVDAACGQLALKASEALKDSSHFRAQGRRRHTP